MLRIALCWELTVNSLKQSISCCEQYFPGLIENIA